MSCHVKIQLWVLSPNIRLTLSHLSTIEIQLWILSLITTTLSQIFFCEDMTFSPFFTGDTTLSSFSDTDSTLTPFPNKNLNHSSSKRSTLSRLFSIFQHGGRLWVAHPKGQFWFVYLTERYVCMNAWKNFEFLFLKDVCLHEWKLWVSLGMKISMFECMETLSFWLFECMHVHVWMHEILIWFFFNMHVWMREILIMHLWMHEHLKKCTYENAFSECIFFSSLSLFSLSFFC